MNDFKKCMKLITTFQKSFTKLLVETDAKLKYYFKLLVNYGSISSTFHDVKHSKKLSI